MYRDRNISIFNMAFYREENVIVGVLIDFDLATYPEEVAIGSTGLSPSTTVTPDGSTDTNPAPMKTGQDQTATFSGGQILKNGQDRSGTTPFMAIETECEKTIPRRTGTSHITDFQRVTRDYFPMLGRIVCQKTRCSPN